MACDEAVILHYDEHISFRYQCLGVNGGSHAHRLGYDPQKVLVLCFGYQGLFSLVSHLALFGGEFWVHLKGCVLTSD